MTKLKINPKNKLGSTQQTREQLSAYGGITTVKSNLVNSLRPYKPYQLPPTKRELEEHSRAKKAAECNLNEHNEVFRKHWGFTLSMEKGKLTIQQESLMFKRGA